MAFLAEDFIFLEIAPSEKTLPPKFSLAPKNSVLATCLAFYDLSLLRYCNSFQSLMDFPNNVAS